MKIKFTYLLLILLLIAAALIFFLIKQNSDKTIASIKSNLSLGAGKGSALNSIDEILEDIIKNVTIYQKIIVHHFHPQTLQFSKKNYDAVIDTIDFYTQFFLEKTLWAQGVWFQINPDLAERSNMFCSWYLWQDTQIVKQLNAPRELNPIEDPYYFLPIKEGKGVWSNVYIDPYIKQEMITYSAPIYSDSILLGVAGIDVTLEKLNNIIRKTTENFKLSYFFVIDNNFNIIAQSDKNADTAQIQETIQILKKSVPPSNLIRLNDCYYFELVEHGQTKLGVFSKISDHFNFIAAIPYTIAYKEFYLLFYSLIFIFIFVLIAFFSAFYSRKKLSDNYKKLQEQSSILNGVIQSTNDLLYYKNSSFQFMGCNDAFLKFIKLNQNDILYKTAVEIHTAIKLTDFEKYEQSVVQENKTIEQEVSFLINDETQYYIFTFTPLKDTNQESIGVLVNGHNISHFKKAEQEILRAKQLSDESNMLKSQFLANVSHEIRTPMNAILNFSDFLLNEPLTEHQREYANAIYQSGENLLELINDLLDISKIEANRLTFESISFSMEKLIYDIIPLIRARAQEKHIDVILQMDDFKYYVIGDPTRLRQIFINLLSNAVKFTEKGQVLFSIKILCEHSDDYCIEIKVQDTGIGIPSDKLDVIFQPFLQVDGSMTRKYGGTGLGLAITKKLIEQMHGAISVKSKENEGSSFTLNLTLPKDTSQIVDVTEIEKFDEKIPVLIVDDIQLNCDILSKICEKFNMQPICFTSATQALTKWNSLPIKPRIGLIDMMMPEMDGNTFAQKLIKISNNSIPLIAVSSTILKHPDTKSFFSAYLLKPVVKRMLFNTIKFVLYKQEQNKKEKTSANYSSNMKELEVDNKFSKILVVDDNEMNIKIIVTLLQKLGFSQIVTANNGEEAVHCVKNAEFDIILMDLQMPVMNGIDALKEIRKLGVDTPIIALTADAMLGKKDKYLELGFDDYLSKPIDKKLFNQLIEQWLKINENNEQKNPQTNNTDLENETIVEEWLKTMEGDAELEAITLAVVKELPIIFQSLQTAFNNRNFKELKALVHSHKGSTGSVGIQSICDILTDIDKELKNEIPNEIRIEQNLKKIKEIITSIPKKYL